MPYDPKADLASVDPLKEAFRQKELPPLYAHALYDGTGQLRVPAPTDGLAPSMGGPEVPTSGGYDPRKDLGLDEDEAPGKLESFGRGALQGLTFGFSDEIAGLAESAFTNKTYKQARDESRAANKKAKEENPWSYGIGEVGGGIGSAALTGGAGLAAKAGLTGVRAAAALGAAEGALSGVGTAEGGIDDSLKSALIGGVAGGALAGAAGKIFGKYAAGAERKAVRDTTKELTEGALPTQARRFADSGALAFDVLEPDKAFMKAAKTRPERAAEIAGDRLRDLGPQTKPIYERLDKEMGRVPLADWRNHFDDKINSIRKSFGGDNAVADALEEARDGFVAKSIANYHKKGMTEVKVSHQDIRDFVTGLYKHKFRKLGTISETENAHLAAEAFETADDFLKGRLNNYRTGATGAAEDLASKVSPKARLDDALPIKSPLAKSAEKAGTSIDQDLDKLSDLNRQIKAWASAETLMEHKTGREFWKRGGLEALASGKMGQLAGLAGAAGAVATGSPFGAALGLVPSAMKVAAKGTRALDQKATAALARLAQAARKGDVSKEMYLNALQAGIGASTAMGVINTMKNRPRWAADEDGTDDE